MRSDELRLDELLEFHPEGGVLRFAGQRALVLDTLALGLLRKQLVDRFGFEAARGVLTRFGYAHGWRSAEALEHRLPWASVEQWRRAGGWLHRLQGMGTFELVHRSEQADPPAFAEAIWRDSYEADQHLLHFGEADTAVCWSLCGFASGYLSRAYGRSIDCVETQCRGRGDALCRMRGDARERALELGYGGELAYYDPRELDVDEGPGREQRAPSKHPREARRGGERADAKEERERGIVARSPAMRAVLDLARRVAPVDSTSLISGPRGVGKERLARFIHRQSGRAGGPFVAIHCGGTPETLLESELFGHAKAAFPGASHDRAGLFEAAHTGTLLLDEVDALSPNMQLRLLAVLQARAHRRVGETTVRPHDVRILAATHRDLAAARVRGDFSGDLYDRLSVVEIHVPPLSARNEDLLALARVFLAEAGERLGRALSGFSPEACALLVGHDWPGNVRELQNVIEHAVALARGRVVESEDLPSFERTRAPAPIDRGAREGFAPTRVSLDMSLAEVERRHIEAVLAASANNKAEAARRLGIGTATLFRRLKQYRREGWGSKA